MAFKILIVEDDKQQAETLAKLLKRASDPDPFEISFAFTLAEGLAKSKEVQPHITLLDLQLPDASDWHVTAQSIRDFYPPVIVVTMMPPAEVEMECYAYGASAVYDKSEVFRVVELLVGSITRTILRQVAPKVFFAGHGN